MFTVARPLPVHRYNGAREDVDAVNPAVSGLCHAVTAVKGTL